jgi:hypothetical protein
MTMEDDHIHWLARAVRDIAYNSSERLWDAVLEVTDTDAARSFYRALKRLVDGGEYPTAMSVVTGLFHLCEMEVPLPVETCCQAPALMQMFLEEFLTESDEFLFDREFMELYEEEPEG